MKFEIEDNRKNMDQLMGDLEFLDENVVDAGILANPDGPGGLNADVIMIDDDKRQNAEGLTVGNVAGFHEFGFGVPERSFVRSTIDTDTLMIESEIQDQMAAVFAVTKTGGEAMTSIGEFAADRMKFTIETSRGIEPLSQERLLQKRAIGTPSTPLINWGILIDTLRHQVHSGR